MILSFCYPEFKLLNYKELMKKIFSTIILLAALSQASSFYAEAEEDFNYSKSIIEKGHGMYLLGGSLTIRKHKALLIEKGGVVKIGPDFLLTNIILKGDAQIIDENLEMILTALSPKEDWEKWSEFYKSEFFPDA